MIVRFRCPHCNQSLTASPEQVGAERKCPKCTGDILVPSGESYLPTKAAPPHAAPLGVPGALQPETPKAPQAASPSEVISLRASPSVKSLICPRCGSASTSEYMENRWQCLKCHGKFVYEPAPSVVVQKQTTVHTGPVQFDAVKEDLQNISGVRNYPGEGRTCPRCGSTFVNPVKGKTAVYNCKNCGLDYTDEKQKHEELVAAFWGFGVLLVLVFLVIVCSGAFGRH